MRFTMPFIHPSQQQTLKHIGQDLDLLGVLQFFSDKDRAISIARYSVTPELSGASGVILIFLKERH